MKKFVFGNAIVNIIFGVIIIAFAIVAMFVVPWIAQFIHIIIAAVIIIYAVAYYLSVRNKYQNKNALMILTVQAVVVIVLGILLLIEQFVTVQIAVGLVFYLHGFIYLLILQLLKLRGSFSVFLIKIAILTLGAYILFGNPPFDLLEWALFIVLVAYGVLLFIVGIDQLTKKKKGAK